MPLAFGIAWGAMLGRLTGGRFGRVSDSQLAGLWPLIPAFLLQGVARGRLGMRASEIGLLLWGGVALFVCLYVFLAARKSGFWLIGLGFAANLLVVVVNGYMPVSLGDAGLGGQLPIGNMTAAGFYGAVNDATQLALFGDVLRMNALGSSYFLSAGDVLLVVGAALYVSEIMVDAARVTTDESLFDTSETP